MDTPDEEKLHAIRTKDGITITDIPDSIPDDSPELAQRVAAIRMGRTGSEPVSVSYEDQSQKAIRAMGEASIPAPSMMAGNVMAGKTDIAGLLGAVERPLVPTAIGATIGGLATGRPEGALAGAGISNAVFAAGDLLVPLINRMFGTTYSTPSDALNHYLTKAGFAIPDSEFERIVQAASTGAAGAIGGVGAGQLLKAGAPVLGARTTAQGAGEVLASQAGSQVIGGAAAGGASEAARELGAPPLVQTAAGLAGGIVGSRLAPGGGNIIRPQVPKARSAEDVSAEIGNLVKKASTVRPGRAAARQRLVALADINPEAKAAADRLGFDLPADVFADNPQVRAAAGLTRSVAGSEPEAAWRSAVTNALDQADDVLKQYDATFIEGTAAPAMVSDRVRDTLTKTRESLNREATALYSEVDQAVPKQTPVKLDNLKAALDEIASEVGDDGLSSQEKSLRNMLKQNPTYGRLLREKNLIGQALARKESPYGNMEAGSLKRLYGALAEDQLSNVEAAKPGMGEQLRSANLIYSKERELGDRIVEVFGSDAEGSIANRMRSSVVSAGKGNGEQFDKLLDLVPEDLRRETVATSLASVARNRRGEFGFAEYANTYRGLRANPPVYARMVKELGEDSDQVLRDLYEVSKRITDARANVLVTGKANQALLRGMSAESFIGKIFRVTVMRTGATVAGAALGGPVGAGVGSAVTDALSHGSRDGLKAAGKMFTSPEFQRMATAAAAGEMPSLKQIRIVAQSSAFDRFARAVKLPVATDQRELWILAALQVQAKGD